MHLTKLSLWESLLRSAKSVKRSRNIWKTWRPSFNRQFFYVQNWQNPTGSQIFSSIPLLWEDARKKSEKSVDEETIECVFGNRIFGWIWLDFFVRRLRLWFWSAAKIENKKVFYFFPMNRRRVICCLSLTIAIIGSGQNLFWHVTQKLVTVRLDTDKKLIIHHFCWLWSLVEIL